MEIKEAIEICEQIKEMKMFDAEVLSPRAKLALSVLIDHAEESAEDDQGMTVVEEAFSSVFKEQP